MEEDGEWWDVMAKMGMPLLYILGISTGNVGAICQGVITSYWASLEQPSCYLYARVSVSCVLVNGSSILLVYPCSVSWILDYGKMQKKLGKEIYFGLILTYSEKKPS